MDECMVKEGGKERGEGRRGNKTEQGGVRVIGKGGEKNVREVERKKE